MCCNLRIHVIAIAIICLTLTGLGALNLISTITAFMAGGSSQDDSEDGDAGLALGIQIVVFGLSIAAEIFCLVGALKNNKCLLIPFMIYLVLIVITCIGLAIWFIYVGALFYTVGTITGHPLGQALGASGGIFALVLLIPVFIGLGLAIYFFVIVVKFYGELSSGIRSGEREGIVLQPYASPQGVPATGGVSTVYVPHGAQNVSHAYQQQPATNVYPQQGYGYPAQNPELKGQV